MGAIFISMDTDGDGLLSLQELRDRMDKSAFIDEKKVSVSVPERLSWDFTYTEFLAATFDRRKFLTERACLSAFHCFDKNGDGAISMSELASGKLLGHMSVEELFQTLEDVDANGDSFIDFDEFTTMMRRHSPMQQIREHGSRQTDRRR